MNDRRFFSGKTLAQAVLMAARHYQVEPERLAYKQIEKKHGFINRRRGVVIEVDPAAPGKSAESTPEAAPRTPESAPAPAPAAPPEPRPQREERPAPPPREPRARREEARQEEREEVWQDETDEDEAFEMPPFVSIQPSLEGLEPAQGEAADAAHHALTVMLRLLSVEPEVKLLQADERLEIVLEGDGTEVLVQDGGEVLTAMQFLVPRIVRGITGESVHCRVDADDFHLRREERLFRLAWKTARRVVETDESASLAAMPPDERRIVHLALAQNQRVSTHSVGHGLYKRIAIRPA